MGIVRWQLKPGKLEAKATIDEEVTQYGVACSDESKQTEVGVFRESGDQSFFVGVVQRGNTLQNQRCRKNDVIIIKSTEEPAREATGLVFF